MKRSKTYILLFFVIGIFGTSLILGIVKRTLLDVGKLSIEYRINAENADTLNIFFDTGGGYSPDNKVDFFLNENSKGTLVKFKLSGISSLQRLRLDFGQHNQAVQVWDIKLKQGYRDELVDLDFKRLFLNCGEDIQPYKSGFEARLTCDDPFITLGEDVQILDFKTLSRRDKIIVGLSAFTLLLTFWFLWSRRIGLPLVERFQPSHLFFLTFLGLALYGHFMIKLAGIELLDFSLEKRSRTMLKDFEFSADYQSNFEKWFEDSFSFRQKLMRNNSRIYYYLYKKSPREDKVVIGDHAELYPSSEFIMNDFKGEMHLTPAQVLSMLKILKERIIYAKEKGMEYYLFWAPTKQTILPSHLPSKYLKQHSPTETMLSEIMFFIQADSLLSSHVCDPRDYLKHVANTSSERIYYQNDMHWNGFGAYFGYQTLVTLIGKTHEGFAPFPIESFNVEAITEEDADLARMLLLQNDCFRIKYNFTSKEIGEIKHREVFGKDRFARYYFEGSDTTLPRALIFRDSFAQEMMQFLSLHFSDAVYVWDQYFDVELIQEHQPDIIIQEITEMFIYELLRVNPETIQIESYS